MNRFQFLLFAAVVLSAADLVAQSTPPNIIMIFSDDQGVHDVGCYGSEIDTPGSTNWPARAFVSRSFMPPAVFARRLDMDC